MYRDYDDEDNNSESSSKYDDYDGSEKKSCPHCGLYGSIDEYFGWRKMPNGKKIPQSWCYNCRSEHNE